MHPRTAAVLNLFLWCYSLLGLTLPLSTTTIQTLSSQQSSEMTYWHHVCVVACCRWLRVCALSPPVPWHTKSWLLVVWWVFTGSRCTGEVLMERKQYVKCCKLIIADRYWLANHFFAADSLELAIWVVSCLSQVMGMEGKKMHTYTHKNTHTGEYICRYTENIYRCVCVCLCVCVCVCEKEWGKEGGEKTKWDKLTDIALGVLQQIEDVELYSHLKLY